jgi:hypothetical protein
MSVRPSHPYRMSLPPCPSFMTTLMIILGAKGSFSNQSSKNLVQACMCLLFQTLTPKGPRPFFGPFLKFGQAIVDAIFVQKISNFW